MRCSQAGLPVFTGRLACAALGLIMLLLPGCQQGIGGVEGLSLPEGSLRRGSPAYFRQLVRDIKSGEGRVKVKLLAFDNPAGWDHVYSHIDSCMKAAGYPELTEEYELAHGGRRKSIDGVYEGEMLRSYEGAGLPCTVTLFNFEAMKRIESYGGERKEGDARFALLIVK